LLFKMSNQLDIFWLDNDNATSLGVDVGKVTKQVLILVAILISVSTALVGPVMFFGLLVANLAKEFFQTYRHKTLLLGSSLMAMSMLLSGQWVIENIFKFETTLSVVINFIGGLYFLSLLVRQKIQ
ncbi:MAG: iron chelate uptake ABC transporter family permease subunit, partial [Psychromonas sp.]